MSFPDHHTHKKSIVSIMFWVQLFLIGKEEIFMLTQKPINLVLILQG